MIEITGLRKSFGSKKVLDGLNMRIKPGEVYGFLGENGAGKSTTMNIITGLLGKDGGEVRINGRELSQSEDHPIGYLPESPEFFDYMTCRQYFTYIAAACSYRGDVRRRTEEVIRLIGLENAIDRKIKGFSRGMKQRIGIGCALYSGKDILILDEPTSALDPQGRAEVMQIIQQLKRMGKTVILSTHILSDVERVADRVGILHNGILQLEGNIAELLRENAGHEIKLETENLPASLREEIARSPFTVSCALTENGGTVEIADDFEGGNLALFRLLAENGILVSSYQVVRPTLEQIYLKVVGTHDAVKGWH